MNNLWSTAEFSKLTGLSIRALHYYDEEGVLIPHHKNEKGFRYYSHEDFLLAQKIVEKEYLTVATAADGRNNFSYAHVQGIANRKYRKDKGRQEKSGHDGIRPNDGF